MSGTKVDTRCKVKRKKKNACTRGRKRGRKVCGVGREREAGREGLNEIMYGNSFSW